MAIPRKRTTPELNPRLVVERGLKWPQMLSIIPHRAFLQTRACDFCGHPMEHVPDGWACSRCLRKEGPDGE